MAVAIAKVTGADYTVSNKRVRVRTLTFSGNYATNGETINASDVGLRKIEQVHFTGGFAAGSTPTSGTIVGAIISSSGTSVAIRHYESAGSAAPPIEKDNGEAYVTGTNVRAEFVGY